ncbi:hypothetical protein KKB43_05735 [Patescibacteria group bacterium]|nr:hypothetical protein [Patescibacteria group bacterium]MBU4580484.1 hypothetical protein [Patescibacteria group bacterium]
MSKNSFQKGAVQISAFAGMAIIAAVVVVASTIAVIKYREISNVVAPVVVITPELTPSVTPTPNSDETADWQTYSSKELDIEFKYPSEWSIPKIRRTGERIHDEITISKQNSDNFEGFITVTPKVDSEFIYIKPKPFFECGDSYFECSPSLTSFNCQPYKTETVSYDKSFVYDNMKIWDDLKKRGFECSITGGRPYEPYIYNPELLQKQFQILEKVSKAEKLDKTLEEEIKSDFTLFKPGRMWGNDSRFYVDLIYNSQINVQGIRIIGYMGSDVSAARYYYKTIFLKNNKIILTNFSLFSGELLDWAEKEMALHINQDIGFDEIIIDAMKDKNKQLKVYKAIQEYDLLSKSLNFSECADNKEINIISPVKDIKWEKNKSYKITWESFGCKNDFVSIKLYKLPVVSLNLVWEENTNTVSPIKGYYDFDVPNNFESGKYQFIIDNKHSEEFYIK